MFIIPIVLWINRDPIGLAGGVNLYQFSGNDPLDNNDPFGLAIWKCWRQAQGIFYWLSGGNLNHAYLWNDKDNSACAQHGSSGSGNPNKPEKGPSVDHCTKVPGSDGKEAAVMACCKKTGSSGIWLPIANDCHEKVNDCLSANGLTPPPAPRISPRTIMILLQAW